MFRMALRRLLSMVDGDRAGAPHLRFCYEVQQPLAAHFARGEEDVSACANRRERQRGQASGLTKSS
jgi:hypothetical protein